MSIQQATTNPAKVRKFILFSADSGGNSLVNFWADLYDNNSGSLLSVRFYQPSADSNNGATYNYTYKVTGHDLVSATKYVFVEPVGESATTLVVANTNKAVFSLESDTHRFSTNIDEANVDLLQLKGACGTSSVGPSIDFLTDKHGQCGIQSVGKISVESPWGTTGIMKFRMPTAAGGTPLNKLSIYANRVEPDTYFKFNEINLKGAASATLAFSTGNIITWTTTTAGVSPHILTAVDLTGAQYQFYWLTNAHLTRSLVFSHDPSANMYTQTGTSRTLLPGDTMQLKVRVVSSTARVEEVG